MLVLTLSFACNGGGIVMHVRVEFDAFHRSFVYNVHLHLGKDSRTRIRLALHHIGLSMPPLSHTWNTYDLTYLNSSLLSLKPCRISETRFAQNSSFRGSSSIGDSVGMEGNLSRQDEPQAPVQPQEPIQSQNPVQSPKPARGPQNPPDVQTIQRECFLSMKEMFDQFAMNLKQGQPVVQSVATPRRDPIDKLAKH
ncbi:hypothetical protein GQ457_03G019840 [Hibiscus cannabinus]